MAGMLLVRIAKDWDWPDLLRQTPGGRGQWGDIRFTLDPVQNCDYLIVLNNRLREDIKVICPGDHIWAIMQEPYIKGLHDWMIEGHECFARVFTHYIPSHDPKYKSSPPAIPWHINRSFDQLTTIPVPDKTKDISWILSRLSFLPMHRRRLSFLNFLYQNDVQIDVFGRGFHYIPDKWQGLAPYRYSIAVENFSRPYFWTEKLADCFLSWTIPLYYGCTNLKDYFPGESFIEIDIDRPAASLSKIRGVLSTEDWQARVPALQEARDLILHRYQFFPYISQFIHAHSDKGASVTTHIVPSYRMYRRRHLKRFIAQQFKEGTVLNLLRVLLNKCRYLWWQTKYRD